MGAGFVDRYILGRRSKFRNFRVPALRHGLRALLGRERAVSGCAGLFSERDRTGCGPEDLSFGEDRTGQDPADLCYDAVSKGNGQEEGILVDQRPL
jgi:hypothetical protein